MSGPEAPRRMSGDHRPGHVRRTDDGRDELRIGPPDEVDPDSLRSLAGVLSELVVSGRRMADAFEAAGRQLSALSVRLERTAGPESAGEESRTAPAGVPRPAGYGLIPPRPSDLTTLPWDRCETIATHTGHAWWRDDSPADGRWNWCRGEPVDEAP